MRTRGGSRRAWQLGLRFGAWFAVGVVLMEATVALPDAPLWVAVLVGVGGGTVVGAVAGPANARAEHEMWRAAGEELTWPQFRAAARASRSGRVPEDPGLREAAIRLGVHQLARHRRHRAGTVVACALGAGISGLNAVLGNWLSLLTVAWFAAIMVVCLRERTKLGKALLRLRA
ncbi:hypothetical protein VA596_48265 [Amycolatopsis sp., V23-08]|uniref:Uncharacterized protein n=1 Tax=Amycolatopsis heterodermiae TaxID=3110235 RepID=A0ABU5RP45_9PSEU|nr:hypothetical protein [Amycolatopsis sp., V23-08]MEA5367399.1 hypothetical protein [Amycolatopsis sp., V23-08]